MVNEPSQYKWSSYQVNALGKKSSLCTPHELYNQLALEKLDRQEAYRKLFELTLRQDLVKDIRKCTN